MKTQITYFSSIRQKTTKMYDFRCLYNYLEKNSFVKFETLMFIKSLSSLSNLFITKLYKLTLLLLYRMYAIKHTYQ